MTRAKPINTDASCGDTDDIFSDASPSGSNLMTHGNASYGTRPRTAQAVAASERGPSARPQKAADGPRTTARRASVSPATYEPNGPGRRAAAPSSRRSPRSPSGWSAVSLDLPQTGLLPEPDQAVLLRQRVGEQAITGLPRPADRSPPPYPRTGAEKRDRRGSPRLPRRPPRRRA